jgi:flagellar assembly protein FliH
MKPWLPPSFDSPTERSDAPPAPGGQQAVGLNQLLTPQELETFGQYPHQEGFLRGLQQGIEEGRVQGQGLGRQEGWKEGYQQGYQSGLAQGLQDGAEDVHRLTGQLRELLESLNTFPQVWAEELGPLVSVAAERLCGGSKPDPALVRRVIDEHLRGLPRPGESLLLRVSPRQWEAWSGITSDADSLRGLGMVVDSGLRADEVVIEIGSTRIDLSDQARRALLQAALGLLKPAASEG